MAIDDGADYTLTGAQVKDLANEINLKIEADTIAPASAIAPITTAMIQDGAVTSDKIDWATITQQAFTSTSYFSQVDINKIIRFGDIVHVVFRGQVGSSDIPNNTTYLSGNLPTSQIGTSEAGMIGCTTTGRYGTGNMALLWGFLSNDNGIRGAGIAANSWVHLNFTYLAM